jgi:hypothetical protein
MPMSTVLKKWYKSPNPALNVHRRDEPVATDTVFRTHPPVMVGRLQPRSLLVLSSLLPMSKA